MLLREGKTLLYFMTNGGILGDTLNNVVEFLPQFKAMCGDNLFIGFGSNGSNNPIRASRVEKAIAEGKLYELIKATDPQLGGGSNINEILKEMAMYHDFQDVDNLFFFSMYNVSDICMVDMNVKRWINRRCFVALGLDDFSQDAGTQYFHGMTHLLYNGKVMNEAQLRFLMQFAQLD
jgi:hypothetical protein